MAKVWHLVSDAGLFCKKCTPFFLKNEPAYNLPLGMISRIETSLDVSANHQFADFKSFVLTKEPDINSEVLGVIWSYPPYPLGLSDLSLPDIELLFQSRLIAETPKELIGPPETVKYFAKFLGPTWANFPSVHTVQNMGIYELTTLQAAFEDVNGEARFAVESDFELVLSWSDKFITDCKTVRPFHFEEMVMQALKQRQRKLWLVDGKPVSMAGTAGFTPNGSRVAWVYTPPQFRRQGFAGAITRSVTIDQLHNGKKYCFLYTDLDNPTSNSIYQKLGYELIAQSQKASLN